MAEAAEAVGEDGEYELTAVLQRWLEVVLAQPHPMRLDEIAREIAELELAFEIANTFPDKEIVQFIAAYPAEKTLYLSDFYMGSAMLDRLLAHHGLDAIVADGLVSCDLMLNKRSGRLFRHVHALYGVSPADHVHIGDNPYADVERPRSIGINAVSYLPEQPHLDRGTREATFASRNALFAQLHASTLQAGEKASETLASHEAAAFQVGLQAAPLFIGFALFIAERAVMDAPDRLFFFTREGEFFHRLYTTLFPEGAHAGHRLPPASVLCVSRQATFAASLEAVTISELGRVWSLNSQQKLSTLFAILDIDIDMLAPLLDELGLSADELIVNPGQDPRILALFSNPQFLTEARASAASRREHLTAYLGQNGVEPGRKLGFIDIGWRGTIQDNIARVLKDNDTVGYYLALRSFLNEQPPNTSKFAFGPDERIESNMDFFETFEPLELLCNSSEGSVSGYRQEGDSIVPIREINQRENAVIDQFTRHFQEGVIAAAKIQQPLLQCHSVHSAELRDTALKVWKKLATRPPKQLLEAYYAAPQHDLFGFGGFFDRGQAPSLGMLAQALFRRKQRELVVQYVKRTQWTAALRLLKVGVLNRWALGVVFWLAHRYKWLKARRRQI